MDDCERRSDELRSESRPRVAVVMPAYNAEKTLERTYADVPKADVDDIILVDDGSRDRTVEIARRLGIHVVAHDKNRGYGGNQKTCYRTAIARGADIVVMVHPDHQYDPTVIPDLLDRSAPAATTRSSAAACSGAGRSRAGCRSGSTSATSS